MKQQNGLPKFALDHLAREQRAEAVMHPDADVLTAFCEGALTDTERSRVMEHIARCGDCREVVFLAAPEALSYVSPREDRSTQNVLKPVANWWRRFMPAVAAVAAVVVVGSAVLLEHRATRTELLKIKVAETAKIGEPTAARANETRATEAQSTQPKQEMTSKVAAGAKEADKLVVNKAVSGAVIGGIVSDQKVGERSFDMPAVGGTLQQLTAAGAHGPIVPKGNATNYQNVAATPARALRVAPGPHGEIEAKGNAYFLDNAVPPVQTTQQVTVEASAAPVSTPSSAAKDQTAPPPNVGTLPMQGRNATNLVAAQPMPEKAKMAKQEAAAPAKSVSQTVEVTAEAVSVEPDRSAASYSKAQRSHWRINEQGNLQRSFGKGEWTDALADSRIKFHAVSVMGNEIWAGGSAGSLYHSLDDGTHWTRVQIDAGGHSLSETITSIKFHDVRAGTVTTASGIVWKTFDGGVHWARK